MPITQVPNPPLRSQGLTQQQYSAEFELFMTAFYQSVIDWNAAASAYQLSVTNPSSTSNTIGTGIKTFTVLAGSGYYVGMPVRAANSVANHMTGEVQSYSGTTLTINVTGVGGSGTFGSWVIGPAAVGANSAGAISFTPTGNIIATNLQAAVAELDSEKLSNSPGSVTGLNLEDITTAETVGNTTTIPVVTKDANGRVTSMTSAQIAAVGVGQTWQNVSGSRTSGVSYTNSTGKPILVATGISSTNGNNFVSAVVDGLVVGTFTGATPTSTAGGGSVAFIVPNGSSYAVTHVGTRSHWAELR
jgi:hypothetical protein